MSDSDEADERPRNPFKVGERSGRRAWLTLAAEAGAALAAIASAIAAIAEWL